MKEYDLLQKCRAYLERAIGTPALPMELRLKAGDLRKEIMDMSDERPLEETDAED
tara:strand:+ start:120 stop:284 length:165 start_codon:yes stop_codon:yes gene_type:complete